MSDSLKKAARRIVLRVIEENMTNKKDLIKIKNEACSEFGVNTFADSELITVLKEIEKEENIQVSQEIHNLFQKRRIRTLSGIAPISVLLPPGPCSSACVYCPTERVSAEGKTLFQIDTEKKYGKQDVPEEFQTPGKLVMPKSYLSSEPGAMRALLAGFNPTIQIHRRLKALEKIGHSVEKCELIVQGGTFSDLPKKFRTRFLIKCYEAFNSFRYDSNTTDEELKQKQIQAYNYEEGEEMSEQEEDERLIHAQKNNEKEKYRVIGLTLETRPDCIDEEEVRDYRRLGCTRVELGVQTIDDEILKKIKRRQTRAQVAESTRLLRQAGFKICYHMMPGLPFSTPEKDLEVYKEICTHPDFCPDLVKIYPCSVVPFSELKQWFEEGKYVPYKENVLYDLLKKIKKVTPPWIRISRLIRDIPKTAIIGGNMVTNLRQLIQAQMHQAGEKCQCIRCREVRDQKFTENDVEFRIRKYEANQGEELFLSYELKDDTLLAMLRLRIPGENEEALFEELKNTAIIRELHSFGISVPVGEKKDDVAQHVGFGGRLIMEAEKIAKEKGFKKIAVISGIGVKEYYRKLGFEDEETYLAKRI